MTKREEEREKSRGRKGKKEKEGGNHTKLETWPLLWMFSEKFLCPLFMAACLLEAPLAG